MLAAPGAWKHKIMKVALDETESVAMVDGVYFYEPLAHAAPRSFLSRER